MGSRTYDITTPLGSIAEFGSALTGNMKDQKEGSLARTLKPKTNEWSDSGQINVVKDYPWTISNKNRDDVPYVRLIEYACNESMIKRQIDFYGKLLPDKFQLTSGTKEVLQVYDEIFPKDNPTDFSYWIPYFNKTSFELASQNWTQLDSIGESLKGIMGGASKFASAIGLRGVGKGLDIATQIGEFAGTAAEAALAWNYPSAGVQDRPRVFAGHNERQVTISFPLFNTINEWDWTKNRDLVYLLMSQNLYNKRDYITGIPPVFYDVYIPGQYYCYAASMTNINVENLGNTRLIDGAYIVPDAYQVTLTLSEMVSPSKNQFEAITSGAAKRFVNSSVVAAEQTAAQNIMSSITTPVGTSIQGTQTVTGEGQTSQP
jgi:hypothetical protein